MKALVTVLWGITVFYTYWNLNQSLNLLPGSKVNLAWKKAPVKQWRE